MTAIQNSTTKDDILQYLLKEGGATAQTLAQAISVTPQAVRRHLKDLTEEKLILHEAIQAKMGRPQHLYRLSPHGRSQFPANYDQFAVDLLHNLSETLPPEQFRTVLQNQWQKKVEEYRDQLGQGCLRSRLQKLIALRSSEGFMSEVHSAVPEGELETQDRFVVTEYTCAIAKVAESFPVICSQELELFVSLFPDCKVERTNWMIKGENYCGYLIQAKR